MKTSIFAPCACGCGAVAALMFFAGCANTPLRQSTSEMDYTPTPAVVELGGHVFKQPVPLSTVRPIHPVELSRLGITGTVMLECSIDETGKVAEAKVQSSTDREFEAPALEAVKKWTFQPATRDGVAVAARVIVPIEFDFEN